MRIQFASRSTNKPAYLCRNCRRGPCEIGTLVGWLLLVSTTWAQPESVRVEPSVKGQPSPGQVRLGTPPGGPPGAQPAPNGKPGEKPGEASKTEPEATSPAAVIRPEAPPKSPAPEELLARPDEAGKIQLNFQGQKWLAVLEWYADVAKLSLDWQEIPGDFLNLRTQRSYTLPEIRDVLNRHLMDRGYTLLRSGEVLVVANLKKLDPALVPRVFPEDLDQMQAHEFVKTSFKLEWLMAESTVEELKPLLSPHGKLWALKATNRIEALDAVSNLLAIRHILKDEQSGTGQERLVREFRLQYSRADDVYDMLLGLLGKEKPKQDEGPMDPRRMMQMQQQMMQMQQQQGQRPGGETAKKAAEIYLVVNRRENSILVNGPPDQVAIVEQAVKQVDVPSQEGVSLLSNPNRMQVYRLSAVDPKPLVETLQQVGNLDPDTQLNVDEKNRSIIAYASLADHMIIKSVIDKLDGTDRRFEVIRLRKLEADYVAGTIQFMMGEAEEKQQSSRRSYYYYDPFSSMNGGSSDKNETRKFRVDADIEHNRLLIWANDIELAEVQNLLVKLGELPPPGSRGSGIRMIDSIPLEDAPFLLERLRQMWPREGDNPLQLKISPRDASEKSQPEPSPLNGTEPLISPTTQVAPHPAREAVAQTLSPPPLFQFSRSSVSSTKPAPLRMNRVMAQLEPEELRTAADDDRLPLTPQTPPRDLSAESARTPAPVIVELDAEGRWVLRSDDTSALDRLEDLLVELAPPRRDYKLFQLKNSTSWAYGIALNLEDFFKEQEEKPARRPYWYYDGNDSSQKSDTANRLSKRRPLKFIADSDSNSILVVGADPNQLRTIEELIEYYDQPVASDAKALRRTEVMHIKHSEAKIIAEAIKDVYRDLLSENDKALQQPNGQNKDQQRASERTVTYVYDSFDDGGDKKGSEPPAPMRFKGALSIGIDEFSNAIVVSSTESLLENIRGLVEELDQAAKPKLPTLQVLQVNRNVPVDVLQEKLAKILKPTPKPQQIPQQPNGGQPNRAQQQVIEANEFP